MHELNNRLDFIKLSRNTIKFWARRLSNLSCPLLKFNNLQLPLSRWGIPVKETTQSYYHFKIAAVAINGRSYKFSEQRQINWMGAICNRTAKQVQWWDIPCCSPIRNIAFSACIRNFLNRKLDYTKRSHSKPLYGPAFVSHLSMGYWGSFKIIISSCKNMIYFRIYFSLGYSIFCNSSPDPRFGGYSECSEGPKGPDKGHVPWPSGLLRIEPYLQPYNHAPFRWIYHFNGFFEVIYPPWHWFELFL